MKRNNNVKQRRDHILTAAINLAVEVGYSNITRDTVAARAGVSMGLITHYFETMGQLKRSIMRAAIHQHIPEIIAQGLANNDKYARKAPSELKNRAAMIIANG